jgi:RNA polymerase sigma-70 factor, ECF subfamily
VTSPIEATDEELVARIVAGEAQLYELLMRRHNRRLYRAIRAVLRNDAETEDVMQDAYVNAFTHLSSFRSEAKFSTWLTRIALHEAFARVRKGRRWAEEEDEMEAKEPSPEQAASDRELGQVLERAIDALPESFRTVFVLRAVEEMSTAETAEALDIPDDTVKTRLHRARALLQKSLLDRVDATAPGLYGFHLSRCDRVVEGVLARLRAT